MLNASLVCRNGLNRLTVLQSMHTTFNTAECAWQTKEVSSNTPQLGTNAIKEAND